jgi:hypothetical protein
MVEGTTMTNNRGRCGSLFPIWAVWWMVAAGPALAGDASNFDALTLRVIHPDRQAANFLKLFEGSRAAHPAAALAAWKRATHNPAQLGKTLEAVIALANPEMVREWKVFDQTELRMNLKPDDGTLRWHFVVPGDDGSAASMITAFRLSDLEDAPPILERGHEYAVTRFIRTASVLLTHVDTTVVFAGSRDELGHAIRRLSPGAPLLESPALGSPPIGQSNRRTDFDRLASKLGSGLVFELRPARVATPSGGSWELRRAIEFLHALECREITGALALEGERLSLDVKTHFNSGDQPSGNDGRPSVDRAWLALIPAQNLVAVVSLAVETSPRFWGRLFGVADRVERVDPEYRNVASLRTRFNLLAKGGALRPEADLWPHLRGVTAAAIGDPEKPGRIGGGILVLHADSLASAVCLADVFVPSLAALGKGKFAFTPSQDASKSTRQTSNSGVGAAAPIAPRRLGAIGGRSLAVRRIGREVLVGWGDERTIQLLGIAGAADRSAANICAGWSEEGKPAPARVGAFWPARLAPPVSSTVAVSPAARVLADDPPLVWWGWNEKGEARDVVFWSDLSWRVRRFLDELPMDAPPYR